MYTFREHANGTKRILMHVLNFLQRSYVHSREKSVKNDSEVFTLFSAPWACAQCQALSSSYPDDPGVHCAKHGALIPYCLSHFIHIVQQPTQLHCTEVGTDGKACLVLKNE